MTDDLLLPEGTRLVHVGPHKTGTTAIQRAFHDNRRAAAEHGVVYAGTGPQPYRPVQELVGGRGRYGSGPPPSGAWGRFAADVASYGDARVVISSETLAGARIEAVRRMRDDLGERVHVVRMARRLDRVLPSRWQQTMVNGGRTPYVEWVREVLSDPTDRFWDRQGYASGTRLWADVLGPENVTVVVVDETDRRWLLDVLERMTGLPAGTLALRGAPDNPALGYGEAVVLRRLNEIAYRGRWRAASYPRLVRGGATRGLRTGGTGGSTPFPAELVPQVVAAASEQHDALLGLGVRVVGDPASLLISPDSVRAASPGALDESAASTTPVAVAQGVGAVVEAVLADGRQPLVAAPQDDDGTRSSGRRPADLTTAQLVREIVARLPRAGTRALRR
ncbi:hypothetical protein CLV56_1111 [Mumia flava]|uniref:Sulfotransferase family protein n=1 Tax=Mumia flava TaxID=1348852 RepID=A0A2M9BG17_9ACTN|nr:hypothetical protein [Mumia flava]PJJ56896.1 hypothetical protein CLV56_1111 [Mumia flava]